MKQMREMKLIKMYILLCIQVMKSITDELVKLSNLVNVEKRNRDESE